VLITRSNLSTRLVARRAIDTAPAQSCQAERQAVGLGARRRSGSLSHQQRRQVVHRQRCLRYTNLVGHPNTGRSTNSTSRIQSGQSLTPDHVHVGQPDQQRAHSRSIGFQAGVPCNSTTSTSLRLAEPLWHAWGSTPNHHPTLRRGEPGIWHLLKERPLFRMHRSDDTIALVGMPELVVGAPGGDSAAEEHDQ